MYMVVKKNMHYFKENISCNIKKAWSQKTNAIIQSIIMIYNDCNFIIFWILMMHLNGGSIKGATIQDILYIWAFSTIAYGVSYFLFGGVKDISRLIISGGLDNYLLYPKHPLIAIMTSSCELSGIGDLIFGILALSIASEFNILKIVLGCIIGIFSSFVFLSMEIILRSLSVWLGDVDFLVEKIITSLLTNLSTYPKEIFSIFMVVLMYTVLPSAYCSYIPTEIIKNGDIYALFSFIGMMLMYLAISIIVFNKALKKYESGNSIVLRY